MPAAARPPGPAPARGTLRALGHRGRIPAGPGHGPPGALPPDTNRIRTAPTRRCGVIKGTGGHRTPAPGEKGPGPAPHPGSPGGPRGARTGQDAAGRGPGPGAPPCTRAREPTAGPVSLVPAGAHAAHDEPAPWVIRSRRRDGLPLTPGSSGSESRTGLPGPPGSPAHRAPRPTGRTGLQGFPAHRAHRPPGAHRAHRPGGHGHPPRPPGRPAPAGIVESTATGRASGEATASDAGSSRRGGQPR